MDGLGGCVRQVELALGQAAAPLGGKRIRVDGLAVDADQAAPHHGIPVKPLHSGGLEPGLEGFALVGLHVDDEAVGCIGRGGLAPRIDQIGAQQHQQHQRQQAHGQRADLHHRIAGAGAQLAGGQHQPARRGGLVDGHPQPAHRHMAGQRKHGHGSGKTAHGQQAQGEVAAGGQQQHGKTRHPQAQHRQRRGLDATHIAPDDAQRRHLGQLQHGWQAERGHQRQAQAQAHQHRPQAGGGQGHVQQAAQQQHKHMVNAVAQAHAQPAGHQTHGGKLQHIGPGHGALGQAQHAQHGAVVQVAGGKPACRDGHGHGTEQGCQQGNEVEKFFGAGQGLLHLGPPGLQRFDACAAQMALVQLGLQPAGIAAHRVIVARHGIAPADAAGGLHQRGGGQIGLVNHHAGRKVHEARALVGLVGQHPRDLQTGIAQQQRLAHLHVQRHQQGGIDPGGARYRNVGGGLPRLAGGRGHRQGAAQRVTGLHHLQRHQPGGTALGLGGTAHGRKAQRLRGPQAQPPGFGLEDFGGGVVAAEHHIATQQLAGIARQATLQSVGKKAHRTERRHRQRDGHQQQAQLARAEVAPQRPHGQRPDARAGSGHAGNGLRGVASMVHV